MTFDIWDLSSGNRITATDDEAGIRQILRELLASGWLADNLSLGLSDGVTVLDGAELVDWLGAGGGDGRSRAQARGSGAPADVPR